MIDTDPAAENSIAKRFAVVFLAALLIALASIGSANYLVNPYGDYSTSYFRPLVQMSRIRKAEIIRQTGPETEGLILGSSRVMQIQPEWLKEKTGLQFVNLGVNSGAPVDFLALTRLFIEQTGKAPRFCVIGLDLESFSAARAIDARLLSHAELSSLISDRISLTDRIQQFQNILSATQLFSSISCFYRNVTGRFPEESSVITADGTVDYLRHQQLVQDNKFNLKKTLEQNKSKHLRRFQEFSSISDERLEEFRQLLELFAEHEVELIVFTTPYHPALVAHLKESTAFSKMKDELLVKMHELQNEYRFSFFDFSEVSSFAGDPNDFLDCVHYLEGNSRRIVNRVFSSTPTGN